jgi:F0F1-type ATP synthase assembly protein I
MPTDNDKSGNVSWREALATVGLALAIPSMIAVPILFGWWLDKKLGTAPVLLIIGLVVGLLSTAFDVYKLLQRFGQFK